MKRFRHHLIDNQDRFRGSIFVFEGQEPEVEPWMAHKIREEGWRLIPDTAPPQQIENLHGVVNWMSLSDQLAQVLQALIVLIDAEWEAEEAQVDEVLARAAQVLGDHTLAHMEVSVGVPENEVGATPESPASPAAPDQPLDEQDGP